MIRASDHIQELSQKLGYFKSEVDTLFHGLKDYQLTWKPSSSEWSIAECMHHVIVYNERYLPQLDQKVNLGYNPERAADSTYRSTYYGNMMVGTVSPDSLYKLKSSASTQPGQNSTSRISETMESMFTSFTALFHRAASCDLNNIMVISPEDSMIKMPLGDKLKYIIEHQLRHLNQMKRVLNHKDFPNL